MRSFVCAILALYVIALGGCAGKNNGLYIGAASADTPAGGHYVIQDVRTGRAVPAIITPAPQALPVTPGK